MQNAFLIHTLDTAPEASKPALQKLLADVGMIPNLAAAMAESPTLIHAFVNLRHQFENGSSFSATEREVLSLVNAIENGCRYCAAIHATFGLQAGLQATAIDRLRSGAAPKDEKMAALATFARRVLRSRGDAAGEDLEEFQSAGFTKAHALEVIARLALSVMANYAGHLTQVPPDEAIRPMYRAD